MMPAFQRKRVETYAVAMLELIEQRLSQWQADQGQPRDILREMKQLTMAIAVKTLLGLDPTHNCATGPDYARVAVGRDYADATPARGVFQGRAHETLEVLVRVRAAEEQPRGAPVGA